MARAEASGAEAAVGSGEMKLPPKKKHFAVKKINALLEVEGCNVAAPYSRFSNFGENIVGEIHTRKNNSSVVEFHWLAPDSELQGKGFLGRISAIS